MLIPTTMDDEVREAKYEDNFHRDLHEEVIVLKPEGDVIIAPINPLMSKYRDFFDKSILTKKLTSEEYYMYRNAPKKFALDIYGNMGYWSMVLFLNECHSMIDFDFEEIKYIDPRRLHTIVDEILTLEGIRNE